jgi:putative SOS response-associated peptidase YedK
MCGRFALFTSPEALARLFGVAEAPALEPRYNIAPTQNIAAVRIAPERKAREWALLRWGLVPFWAADPRIGSRLINARSETAAEKPAFRHAFRLRRCLVPADGFYEWQRLAREKRPYFIRLRERETFAIAGLWEEWRGPEGAAIASCTLLTTEANALMRPLHDRMPAILPPQDYDLWLDPDVQRPEALLPLLKPYPAEAMIAYPVRPLVNNPANDSPLCVEPLSQGGSF